LLVFGYDKELAQWAGARLGVPDFGLSVAIGVARNSEIVAVALFNNYRHPNIEITFVTSTPRWATRQTIAVILRYPFKQLGCKRLTAVTEATNQPARAFLCRLGFTQEGYHPDALPTGDAVTYGLLAKDAARWVAEEYQFGQIPTDGSRRSLAGRHCGGTNWIER
jgi:RimJ/RimL family protein N-acetyltransferase